MMRSIGRIDFSNFEESLPAFLTLLVMPLTFSIATGLAFGFASYVLLMLFLGKIRQCDPFLLLAATLGLLSFCLERGIVPCRRHYLPANQPCGKICRQYKKSR